ncbi:glycosyltransferase family 39 protein [Candidatus Falkowbacteria bacterium]|nr:glycosyltransferase family 39 protein [Candidatus Falkowbacteria bacterium]
MRIEFTKKDLFFILAVLSVSILLVVLIYPWFSLMTTDGVFYALMGESLAKGEGLSVYGQPHLIFSPLLSVFIAFFFLIARDLYFAAHLGVIFCGLASVAAIYILVKEMVSRRAAQIAALFLAFSGVWIWQYTVTISAQIPAGLFAILTALALWKASGVKDLPSIRDYLWFLAAGVFIGLSYLARPEYFIILLFALIYFFGVILSPSIKHRINFSDGSHRRENSLTRRFFIAFRMTKGRGVCRFGGARAKTLVAALLLVIVGFLVVSSPYLLFLHKHLGHWTITGRMAEGSMGLSGIEMEKIDDVGGGTAIVSPSKFDRGVLQVFSENFGALSKKTFDGLLTTEHNFLQVFGFLGVGFFAFGLHRWLLEKRLKEFAIFLISLSPVVLVALYQGATPNYLVQFLYIFLILAAVGFRDFYDKIVSGFHLNGWPASNASRSNAGWRAKTLFFGLISVTVFYFFFPALQNYLFLPKDYSEKEFKQMGLWMNENTPNIEQKTVYSRKPEVAFYAGSKWQIVPNVDSYEQLFSAMKKNNIQYLVVDDRYFKAARPQFNDLLSPDKAPENLKLIKTTEFYGKRVLLYQLQ